MGYSPGTYGTVGIAYETTQDIFKNNLLNILGSLLDVYQFLLKKAQFFVQLKFICLFLVKKYLSLVFKCMYATKCLKCLVFQV